MNQAPAATSAAKMTRPARELGVVFGSEIMKNEKISSAPFSSLCKGIVNGSPRRIARVKRIADQIKRNASVTSLRMLRKTTKPPAQRMRKPKNAVEPHCPGETHARGLAS